MRDATRKMLRQNPRSENCAIEARLPAESPTTDYRRFARIRPLFSNKGVRQCREKSNSSRFGSRTCVEGTPIRREQRISKGKARIRSIQTARGCSRARCIEPGWTVLRGDMLRRAARGCAELSYAGSERAKRRSTPLRKRGKHQQREGRATKPATKRKGPSPWMQGKGPRSASKRLWH